VPRSAWLAVALSPVLTIGCKRSGPATPPSPDPKEVIAVWSGGRFTRGDIEPTIARRLDLNPAEPRAALVKRAIERQTRMQILYRQAVAEGILERPQVKTILGAVEERALADDWLTRHAARVQAQESLVEKEVQTIVAQSGGQEVRRFGNIFLRAPDSDPQARAKARERMEQVRRELADGASFEELARKYSDSITARGGGRVDWTPRAPLHDTVAETVFSLSEGQVSEPVETEMGVHLFRLDGIRRPTAPDVKMIREDVKRRLDAEAVEAAISAERARTFEASGVRLDARALSRPGSKDQVVAVIGGQPLSREEFDALRAGFNAPQAQHPPLEFARWLVVNRILSQRRRAEPIDDALQKKLDDARLGAVVDMRWRQLTAGVSKEVTAKEVAEFYEKYRDQGAIFRDHVVDVLFFTQKGPAAAEVYAKGEAVSAELRRGDSFDAILERHAREPGVVIRRRVSSGDVKTLRNQSLRFGGTVSKIGIGEVSPPFYMEGETVTAIDKAVILNARGLAFLRLVEVRPQPLEAVRDRVIDILQRQKEMDKVTAVRAKLDQEAAVKILVANP
jgi:hypothetical protein